MGKKIFCIVNPNLKDRLGHYFEYVHSLAAPARKMGYELLLLARKDAEPMITEAFPTKKVFTREIWHTMPGVSRIPKIGVKLNTWIENFRFFLIIRFVLNRKVVTRDWVVFCDMVCHNQLRAWAWWFNGLPRDKAPRLVLLFRYSSEWFDYYSDPETTAKAFKTLGQAAGGNMLCLCSDSARLAKDYSRFTDLPIEVFLRSFRFPIP